MMATRGRLLALQTISKLSQSNHHSMTKYYKNLYSFINRPFSSRTPIILQQNQQQNQNQQQSQSQSQPSEQQKKKGFFSKAQDWMYNRKKTNEEKQKSNQIKKISELTTWNLQAFANELNESITGWSQYIPGIRNLDAIEVVNQQKKLAKAMIEEIGKDCTMGKIQRVMGRKEKLKVCLKADVSLQDVDTFINQFQNMGTMHQVLRYRKLQGKSIPTNDHMMEAALKEDLEKVLSKGQKKTMRESQMKNARGRR